MNKLYNERGVRGLRCWVIPKLLILLISLLLTTKVYSQQKTIVGLVIDEKSEVLPGVSILVKGTKQSVQTDKDGKFKIQALATDRLVFNYIGYTTQEVIVGTKTSINVSMSPSSTSLNDVVVVGYGTQKRSDLTGSIGSVNMKDFAKAPVKSFDEALAGRVAGVQVQSSDGQPGAVANIIIRGAGSITQDNSPLYVVDGFPSESSNANSISPSDIESIDVLKDASATAIYGARGANGVVLITTKKGKSGPPQVVYNAYYGIQKVPEKIKLMDAYEFVRYVKDLNSPFADSTYLKNGTTLDSYRNATSLDMQDYVYQTGQNQNHDIAIRGGTEGTQYAISGNFNNQKGIVKFGGFRRYQGRFVLDQKINNKIKAGINANYANSEQFGIPVSATNFYASSVLLYSVWGQRPTNGVSVSGKNYDPLVDFYDPVNEFGNNQDYRVNPLLNLQNQQTRFKTNNLTANAYAEYAILKNLTFRVAGGITKNNVETNILNNSKTQAGSKYVASGPNGTIGFANQASWLSDNTLNYKAKLGKNHNFNALVNYNAQGNNSSNRSFTAFQLPNEDLGLDGLDLAAAANTSRVSNSSRWAMQSVLARVNYDYKSKYLLTASVRADGSSKFPPGSKWGYFPSVSGAWRFSNEEFMKNLNWISNAKLRVGFGQSGNNRVGDFAYMQQLQLSNTNYWYSANNQPAQNGTYLSAIGNENLRWETSEQTNIGLDLGFLKDRISVTADIYRKKTKDLLLNASLPYSIGVEGSAGFKNVGSLQNQGLELSIDSRNIVTKDFSWSTNFNISFNQNKILALTDNQNYLLAGNGTFFNTTYSGLFPYISMVGNPLGQMYGLASDGVYQYGDFDKMPNGTYLLKSNVTTNLAARTAVQPGDVKYKDINGDLLINGSDYTVIGNGLPKYTGGFSNNFSYKGFDLNVLLQWSVGNDVINANRYIFEGGIVANPNLNQFASYAERWTPINPNNTYFRAGGQGAAAYSSRVIEDGSYLKLRTVSFGYTVPKNTIQRWGMNNLRINVSAQNLATITRYSGMDPEISSRQSNLTPGFDYAGYPHSLTIVFGVNATF
ncbi:TonB-dependent receptor [Pedobacter frigiditerrae]|uniref:TonB-dependent receptor n=1 Tax=Pedobacter frigiditerrae TaxID=2530452 RepID=A0A4R0MQS5_9SPHI|nr:TonB-dependent receptor [Pedobacter frigiditerrae]TCC89215.1 TonB-dependent receptor [Pedobacter frigiditerrae]